MHIEMVLSWDHHRQHQEADHRANRTCKVAINVAIDRGAICNGQVAGVWQILYCLTQDHGVLVEDRVHRNEHSSDVG